MDATKWTQGFQEMINIKPMEQLLPNNNNTNTYIATTTPRPNAPASNANANANATAPTAANNNNNSERKVRPQEKLNCPRCNSTNTKFCYYNNYSLTQPRYFCKGCRRYWTEGGSLRNVPVGGSSRKNKRSSLPSSSSSLPSSSLPSSFSKLPDLNPPILFSKSSKGSSQDLNLMSFPLMQDHHHHHHHALELLRSNGGVNSMMDPNTVLYSSLGFPAMQDYKQSNNLSFSIDHHHHHHQGIGHNTNHHQQQQNQEEINGTSRILFPFSDMKELSNTTQVHDDDNQQHKNHGNNNNNHNNNHNNNYWSGMFSNTGGSSW